MTVMDAQPVAMPLVHDEERFREMVEEDLRTPGTYAWLQEPVFVERWIATLRSIVASVDGQLAASKADIQRKKMECSRRGAAGQREFEAYLAQKLAWRGKASSYKHRVQSRLQDARTVYSDLCQSAGGEIYKVKFGTDQSRRAFEEIRRAVESHRRRTLANDFEPTPEDENLWAMLRRWQMDED